MSRIDIFPHSQRVEDIQLLIDDDPSVFTVTRKAKTSARVDQEPSDVTFEIVAKVFEDTDFAKAKTDGGERASKAKTYALTRSDNVEVKDEWNRREDEDRYSVVHCEKILDTVCRVQLERIK